MSGDGELERLAIPSQTFRVLHDDTERTRLLKDVLRSSVALQENDGKNRPRKVALGMVDPPRGLRKDRLRRRAGRTLNLGELATCQDGDDLCAEMAGGGDLSPLLRQCGQRISGLCTSLQASDRSLKAFDASRKESAASRATASTPEIRLLHRDDEAPGAARARNERVIYDFVAKHAHFARLEEFKDTVDRADGFEGLREVIPRRFYHHPNLALLDDELLKDAEKFREAIWSAPPAPTPVVVRRSKVGQSRNTLGMQVRTDFDDPHHAKRLQKDRSAPTLRFQKAVRTISLGV